MSVQGLAEFNRQLTQDIPADILAAIRGSIEETVAPVVQQMKSLAAYDASPAPRRHAEHLRDTIRIKWIAPKDAENSALALKLLIIAGSAGTGVLVSGKSGHRLQLARLIEFGTQRHPARPFFFPVWRAYRRGVRRKVSSQVNKVIIAYSNTSDVEAAA